MKSNKTFFISTINFAFNQYLKSIINELEKDHDITLISNFKVYEREQFLSKQIHLPIKRGLNPLNIFRVYFAFLKIIIWEKPKIIYTISPIVGFIISLIPKYNFKHIHIFTGQVWYNKTGSNRFYLKIIDKIIGKRCDLSLVDSPSQRDYLLFNDIIEHNNSFVLGHGSIRGNKIKSTEIIYKGKKKKQLLFVGRVNKEKGFNLIVRFINENAKWLKENKFIIIVAGAIEDRSLLNNVQYPELLVIKGHLKSLTTLYSESYCLLLPSEREGFGSVVVESGIYYTPSILSKIVGLIDAGSDDSSIFIEPNDYVAFSEAIIKIVSNLQLHEKMSVASHLHSRKFYSDNCTNYYTRFHKLISNSKL